MKSERNDDIYEPGNVARLFDSMSKTYGLTNYLSSFGFTQRWRNQCISYLPAHDSLIYGYDLMSGMGELNNSLKKILKPGAKIRAIDISAAMNHEAQKRKDKYHFTVETSQADILQEPLPAASADFVVSSFGLKTFHPDQLAKLAVVTASLLKPAGVFSFVEVSTPGAKWLQVPFMFYLKKLIPIIGRICKGNSSDYRMLGVYCQNFQNASGFAAMLQAQGLEAHYKPLFGGCASVVFGRRPL